MGKKLTFSKNIKYWIIPCIAVAFVWFLIGTVGYYHIKSEKSKLKLETEVTGEQIKIRLESWVNHRVEIVENMAYHSENLQTFDSVSFQHKAEELLSWIPGLQALNWVDNDWNIQIVVPYAGNEQALGKNLKNHPFKSVQESLAQAKKNKSIVRTTVLELLQGGKGFATYWPILSDDGNIEGYVNGVLKIDQLIESCFSEPMLTERFLINFSENNKPVYTSDLNNYNNSRHYFTSEFLVKFVDKDMKMAIMPTESYIVASTSFISYWILAFTLLFSLGLGVLLRNSMLHNQMMRKSEKRFRTVVENAGDAFYLVNQNGDIVDVNQQACKELLYTKKELTSMSIRDIDQRYDDYKVELKPGESVIFETTHTRKDNVVIPVEIRTNYIEIHDDIYSLCLSRDISESKKLHELETRSQRLETAGQVAGQVAHDFNNLLAPLIAYPEFINDMLDDEHPAKDLIKKIESSANQIAEINQQLLTLGRRGHYTLQVININELIEQVITDLQIENFDNKICTDFENNILPIKGGYSQIVRIILNLVHNAYDAIDANGNVSIKTENYYLDDSSPEYGNIPIGEYVKISVVDNGHGIPEDILPIIFDPFTSTKAANKKRGSGLGLSIVDSVVKDHNGYVDVKTEVDEGTEFYLYFPITREEISDVNSDDIVGGQENILVVDDDEMILEVTQKILTILGYKTTIATTGEKALDLLRQESFDLLILDMIIPNSIDGTETFKRALEINPDQKAIIVSGYAESLRVNEAIELGVSAFVKKPFSKDTLSKEIRNALQDNLTTSDKSLKPA